MMQPNSFHTKLRQQTQSSHDRVEQLSLPNKLFNLSIEEKEYTIYLQKLYTIHYTIERQLNNFAQWGEYDIDIILYFRRNLIVKDLKILNETVPLEGDESFCIESFPKALGYLYVLTGSTMGGMILSKKVQETFSQAPFHLANNYFDAFGPATHSRFLHLMNSIMLFIEKNPEQEDEIIAGAKECYEYITKSLEK